MLIEREGLAEENKDRTIQLFTPEAREKLEKLGYKIYLLTGRPVKTFRRTIGLFQSTWHKEHPELEEMKSGYSEVAFNPDRLLLPGSNGKTLEQQEKIVAEFSSGFQKKGIVGVEAVIGEMPDYIGLFLKYFKETGRNLFAIDYLNYARTETKTDDNFNIAVGCFHTGRGQYIPGWGHVKGDDNVFVAPLVVPVTSRNL